MKRNLLFTIALSAFFTAPVIAAVTPEEASDTEYLINQGYSQVVVEDVFMCKNRATGKPIEPLYEKSQNKFVKFCKKFYAYLDPGIDEVDRLYHDIKPSPSYTDL